MRTTSSQPVSGFRISSQRKAAKLQSSIRDIINLKLSQSGITQADLAKVMGVSRANVSTMLENGRNMTVSSVAKVLLVLGYELQVRAVSIKQLSDEVKSATEESRQL